jgi:hypothetical protein
MFVSAVKKWMLRREFFAYLIQFNSMQSQLVGDKEVRKTRGAADLRVAAVSRSRLGQFATY